MLLRLGLAVAVVGLVASCGGARGRVVRDDAGVPTVRATRAMHLQADRALALAVSDLSCRREALTPFVASTGRYVVRGCGRSATYDCSETTCMMRQGDGAPAGGTMTGAQWPDGDVRTLVQQINEPIVACFGSDRVPATVRIILAREGTIATRSIVSDATDDERRCVEGILAGVDLDGTHAPRTVVLQFAPRAQDITPGGGPTDAEQEWDVESPLRTQLDAHASRILMCTNAPVAVSVSWTAEGHIETMLRGRFHGQPEEGCVRQVLADLRIEAVGRGGTLIHPIEP